MVRDDAEELRRRLYAPGASDADVERYRRVEPAVVVAERTPPPPPPAPPRRSRLLAVAVVVLVVVVALVVVVTQARSTPPVPQPTPVPMTAADRQDALTDLAAGNGGGIAAFLLTHRAPPGLEHATRFYTLEDAGIGPGTFEVAPVTAETFRGRATVLLVVDRPADVQWTTFRRAIGPDGVQRLVLQEQRGGEQAAGSLTSATFRYGSGDRPVELRVAAPDGVRWGVAIVLSD
ncbi:hypothetical protein [Amnibacterium sp.]|uniref:hypothetical protein n=1 Tax=Amnibacterium sp. TaxID=1872496 RepID=UPI003F7C88CE